MVACSDNNALDRGYGLRKNNCLAQAVEAVVGNVRVGTRPIQMYEWTRTFHPNTDAANGVCDERHRLWAIAEGTVETNRWLGRPRTADAWMLKGLVEEIATALRVPLKIASADETHPLSDCLHPGRQASITLNGETVGILGEVHPRITKAFKLKRAHPVYLEITRSALLSDAVTHRYQERSVHQPIMRSLAFSLPSGITAGEVAQTLSEAGPEWLESVDIVDAFVHEEDGEPMRAITFSLRYGNREGDRSAEAVNDASSSLIDAVVTTYGDRGVKLRA